MAHGILAPFDGSGFALRALPYAELLARRFGAPLTLVEAVETAPHGGNAPERARAEADARLAATQATLRGRGLAVETTLAVGRPAEVIGDAARASEAELIVMATHGRSGPSHLALGSVAEQVLRATHLPVLLLPPAALHAGPPERLARRVVVPYDGSALGASIFPIVQTLAAGLHSPVTLLQAIDPAAFMSYGALDPFGTIARPDLVDAAVAAAQTELAQVAARWGSPDCPVTTAVERGSPRSVIPAYVEAAQAGWIAMASHGRGGLGGLVLGSVALHVLRHLAAPILIAAQPTAVPYRLGAAAAPAPALTAR